MRPIGDRCRLEPELDRIPLLERGLNDYQLTGTPRTPAYAKVIDMGPGVPYETVPRVEYGQVVLLDLSHVILDVQIESRRTWYIRMQHLRAIVAEPNAQPVPLNDFVLTEQVPNEMIRHMAPNLAAMGDIVLPDHIRRKGFAGDKTEASKNTPVLTYKMERVVDVADGRWVGKGFRPHDRYAIGSVALFSGVRAMPVRWRDVNDKLHEGSLVPWADVHGIQEE